MPFLRQIRIEQHLDRWAVEPAGEHLAVVGEDLAGDRVGSQRLREHAADRARSGAGDQPGRDAVPGVVVDPGDGFDLGAVSEQDAAHHVELPQLHRA
jgi:hypothetical protein